MRNLATLTSFSALQRAEIAEMMRAESLPAYVEAIVSVLFNEPKLLKSQGLQRRPANVQVSVLFNEPKLLKCICEVAGHGVDGSFSALQRAEIAEI